MTSFRCGFADQFHMLPEKPESLLVFRRPPAFHPEHREGLKRRAEPSGLDLQGDEIAPWTSDADFRSRTYTKVASRDMV